MARPLRLDFPGALHHVIARGNERREIFRDDRDREFYLERLAHYRTRHGFRLYAYCLMTNHVHLAIGTAKTPLSRTMLGLQSSYTQAFNRRHDRSGHLFQGRYGAFLVEKDRYFLALLRYIHRNPVEAGLAPRADRYRWSSDRFYRAGRGPEWLDLDEGLRLLDSQAAAAVERYRELMGEASAEEYDEVPRIAQVVKGDSEFADRVIEAAETPELNRRRLTVDSITRLVAASTGDGVDVLRGTSRVRQVSRSRAIVAYLAKLHGRIPFAHVAEYFNRGATTMSKDVRRLEEAMRDSAVVRKRVAALSRALGNNT